MNSASEPCRVCSDIRDWFVIRKISLCLALLTGCSNRENTVPVNTSQVASEASTQGVSADEAVRQVLGGLRQGRVRPLWDFLPPSYRDDLQRVVRDVAARLDENDWQRVVTVWRKAQRVLSDKNKVLLSHDADCGEETSALLVNPAALVRILNIVEQSEFADLQQLRTINLERFLESSGDELLRSLTELSVEVPATERQVLIQAAVLQRNDPLAVLSLFEVQLVSSKDHQAQVRIGPSGGAGVEYEFVRVEDHWLPKSLVDGWPAGLRSVREQSLTWAESLRQKPSPWQIHWTAIDLWLDELSATMTATETKQVYERGLTTLLLAWTDATGTPNTAEPQPKTVPAAPQEPRRPRRPDTEELVP